jgi:hypothetical protein
MPTAALLISAIIATLFACTLLDWDASRPVALLFIGAMPAVFLALLLFLLEVFLATAGLRLGPRARRRPGRPCPAPEPAE